MKEVRQKSTYCIPIHIKHYKMQAIGTKNREVVTWGSSLGGTEGDYPGAWGKF